MRWLYCWKRRDFLSTRQNFYFGVTHCENSEVQIAVFSKWNVLRKWKLVQRFFFVYLQPSVNKNSWNFAQFWLYNLMTSLWRHIIFATRKKPLAPSIWPYFYSIYRPYPIYENSYLAPRHGAIKQKKCIIHFWACILIYRSWFIEHHQLSFNRYCKSLINCVVKNQRT